MRLFLLLGFMLSIVTVNAQVTANAGLDISICMQDTLKVIGKGLNPGDTGTYQWREIVSNKIISSNAYLSIKITDTITKYIELEVIRTANGIVYSDLDTFKLTAFALPIFLFRGISPRCFNDGSINISNLVAARTWNGWVEPVSSFWQNRNPSWLSGYNGKIWCPLIGNNQIPVNGLKDTIYYDYRDYNGCYNSGWMIIKLNANPEVKLNDGIFCQKDGFVNLDKLAVIPFNKVGGVQTWRCLEVPSTSGVDNDAIIIVDNSAFPSKTYIDIGLEGEKHKTGDYIVEYCFKNPTTSCQSCDTAKVTVVRLPEFEFDTIQTHCVNENIALDSFVRLRGSNKVYIGGDWQCVAFNDSRDQTDNVVKDVIQKSVINMEYFRPINKGKYFLKIADITSGCYASDSVYFFVNALPLVKIAVPRTVCSDEQPLKLVSSYGNDTNGFWTGSYINADYFYPKQAFASGIGAYTVEYIYTHPITLCSNIDSATINVIRTPEIDFKWSKQQGTDSIYDFSLSVPFFDSSEYSVLWDFGNGITSVYKQPANIAYKLNDSFDVSCKVINQQGCADTLAKQIVTKAVSASKNHMLKPYIKVYPNPGNGRVNIASDYSFRLMVVDITGKIILQSTNCKTLDLPKGVYFLRFDFEDVVVMEKLIIY